MSHHPEERASDGVVPLSTAQVLPFERPQSELQKAVQQRAQETIDRERDRAVAQRPPAWRRVLVLALATIPVFLTFGAAIGFVGALRQFNSAVFDSAQENPPPPPSATDQAPTTEPDVVLLQPYVTQPRTQDSGNSTVTREGT